MIATGEENMVAIAALLKKLTTWGGPAEKHPSYFVGDKWTPSKEQIEEARERQQKRRRENAWRRVDSGPDLEAARAAILCATNEAPRDNPEAAQRLRTIRSLVFESGAAVFVRNLRVSTDRLLIEFFHPSLTGIDGRTPVGLRFIGLKMSAWKQEDKIGIFIDGSSSPLTTLFARNFEDTIRIPDLAESYLRFRFDHQALGEDDQIYLVSDKDDFIFDDRRDIASATTAQFRLVASPGPEPVEEKLSKALGIPIDSLIPPTFVPADDTTHAMVFTTLIMHQQLYHVSWELRTNGDVIPLGLSERRRTPDGETLPVVPLRSFVEQVKTLNQASK
jgi:hypothetical protein